MHSADMTMTNPSSGGDWRQPRGSSAADGRTSADRLGSTVRGRASEIVALTLTEKVALSTQHFGHARALGVRKGAAMNESAFIEYVAARRPQLFRTACLICGDPHRAEDVVQDALTRLYAAWGRVERMDNIDGYVRSIIVNAHYSDRRRPWRRERPSEPRDVPLEPGFAVEDAQVIRAALGARSFLAMASRLVLRERDVQRSERHGSSTRQVRKRPLLDPGRSPLWGERRSDSS